MCEIIHENEVDLGCTANIHENVRLNEFKAAADDLQPDLKLFSQILQDSSSHLEIRAIFKFECEGDQLFEKFQQYLINDGIALNCFFEVGNLLSFQHIEKLSKK